jgi:predicted dehydrogenase
VVSLIVSYLAKLDFEISMSINIALIGSGIFAREQHLPAILSSPHFSLRAIYSRSHNSAVSLLSSLPSSSHADIELYCSDSDPSRTYASLLRRPDIHAVSIALPITTQSEFIAAALRAGKHVLSEKPMGPDVETARKLLACLTEARLHKNIDSNAETNVSNDVSASSNIIWAVGENVRFLPSFHYAREQIEKLGEVTGFRTQVLRNTRAGERIYGKHFVIPQQ